MRKEITLAAVALMGIAAFVGCKKKDSTPGYSMSAKVGTTSFSANNCYATPAGTT